MYGRSIFISKLFQHSLGVSMYNIDTRLIPRAFVKKPFLFRTMPLKEAIKSSMRVRKMFFCEYYGLAELKILLPKNDKNYSTLLYEVKNGRKQCNKGGAPTPAL